MSSFDIIKENMKIYRKGEKAKNKIVEEINNILLNKEYAEFFGIEKLHRYKDILEVKFDEDIDEIKITEEYPVWDGETEKEYYYFPIKWISDETALKEAIQKDKEERKRIAEEEAKRQKEIENENKKLDKEYRQYLKLKEKFKDVD